MNVPLLHTHLFITIAIALEHAGKKDRKNKKKSEVDSANASGTQALTKKRRPPFRKRAEGEITRFAAKIRKFCEKF